MSSTNTRQTRNRRGGRALGVAIAAASLAALSGCDGILDVELPGQITGDELFSPDQATVVVTSAIAEFECAYSEFIASNAAGNEDVMLRVTGWWGGSFEFEPTPNTGGCNTSEQGYGWWNPIQSARFIAEEAYERISEWDPAEIEGNQDELLAQSALYLGAIYGLFGEHFCEVAIEAGPLMSPDQTLGEAEGWLTTALSHAGNLGDFAIPHGISPSAEQTAYLLRARVRLARGDTQGAEEDALQVTQGHMAYVTRDSGGERSRWNRVNNANNGAQHGSVMGPIDWWDGPGDWPEVIPFTGYRDLGILPDGRAVSADQTPITTVDFATAVPDTRVPVTEEGVFNDFPAFHQQKYPTLGSDIPLANWREAWLILAEIEGGQQAIDRVNDLREDAGLPLVTYLDASDDDGIRDMLIEERRRALFLEGRYWTTKIRKGLWFPRGVGVTPFPYAYQTAVRMAMPTAEYELNPNASPDDIGTGCDPDEAPLL